MNGRPCSVLPTLPEDQILVLSTHIRQHSCLITPAPEYPASPAGLHGHLHTCAHKHTHIKKSCFFQHLLIWFISHHLLYKVTTHSLLQHKLFMWNFFLFYYLKISYMHILCLDQLYFLFPIPFPPVPPLLPYHFSYQIRVL